MPKKNTEHNRKSECPTPKGVLLAIGGKENKGGPPKPGSNQEGNGNFENMEILERFCKEMRGQNPMIGIIPTASSEPEEMAKDYLEAFGKLGMINIHVIPIEARADAQNPEICKMLEQVDGVMFTGGDQLKLTALLGGTRFMQILKERYIYDNIVIAGTSAGAAALSTPMIYTGQSDGGFRKGDVYITTGLEFMRDVAIDTHFISRGRISRMAQAIATNPQCIGIGLEEDTAILFTEGKNMEVLGSGLIVIVDGMNMNYTNVHAIEPGVPVSVRGLQIHMLGKGERYTLPVQEQLHE